MGRPAKTLAPPASKSPERMELEELAAKLSDAATVDAFTNPNGHVLIVSATRADTRCARLYVEGASSLAAGELVCLAALRAMVGGKS